MDSINTIIKFLKNQLEDKPAILGISGGIDSALVAYLAVETIGNKKIHGIYMPSHTNTPAETARANEVAAALNIPLETIDIDPLVDVYKKQANFFDTKATEGNLKARIRMSFLYGKANKLNGLVLGTGNKTEIMLGYFTKYGDAGVDIQPITALYKKDVYALAKEMGVPQSIIDAAPTAGLWEGQTDEAELGFSYDTADTILQAIENNAPLDTFDTTTVTRIKAYIKASEHKRHLPPICY